MKDEKKAIADSVTEIGVNLLEFHDPRLFRDLLGQHDQHLKIIQSSLQVRIRVRGSSMEIEGDPLQVELTSQLLRQLYGLLEKGYPVYASDVDYAIRILSGDGRAKLQDIFLDTIYISAHKRTITPKSIAQKAYIDAIRRYDIVFGIGPAGTGKTYLAMAMAVAELMRNNYVRIILTRPAVEAGEKLGFLPGDLAEKVNPYLRPLYDALHDMVDFDRARKLVRGGGLRGVTRRGRGRLRDVGQCRRAGLACGVRRLRDLSGPVRLQRARRAASGVGDSTRLGRASDRTRAGDAVRMVSR